jgi:hypothetical protein
MEVTVLATGERYTIFETQRVRSVQVNSLDELEQKFPLAWYAFSHLAVENMEISKRFWQYIANGAFLCYY